MKANLVLRSPKRMDGVEYPTGTIVGEVTLLKGVSAERLGLCLDAKIIGCEAADDAAAKGGKKDDAAAKGGAK